MILNQVSVQTVTECSGIKKKTKSLNVSNSLKLSPLLCHLLAKTC